MTQTSGTNIWATNKLKLVTLSSKIDWHNEVDHKTGAANSRLSDLHNRASCHIIKMNEIFRLVQVNVQWQQVSALKQVNSS